MKLSKLESINLAVFGGIGGYAAIIGLKLIVTGNHGVPTVYLGFIHSPETYMIAGLGLVALCYKYGLYGFPLFMVVANLSELPWQYLSPIAWTQIVFLMGGYLVARPQFKSIAWVLVAILMNQPGGLQTPFPILYQIPYLDFSFFYYHHIAEIATFIVFLFDIKSLKSPLVK